MTEYRNIGKWVAAFGVKGELLLRHSLGRKCAFDKLEAFFMEEGPDRFLPWFLQSARIKSDTETYVILEGINSRENALKLLQKQVWIRKEDYEKFASSSAPGSLLGYMIVNRKEKLGEIEEVIEQAQQILCRINWKGREALIPLHEDSLVRIDKKKKVVWVNLPDGLLEIFE